MKKKIVDELEELKEKILSGELEGQKAELLVSLAIAKRLEDISKTLESIDSELSHFSVFTY